MLNTILKPALKKAIVKILAHKGYGLVKLSSPSNGRTMEDAFAAIAKRKHVFNTVIDVGASDGRWAEPLMKYFPDSQYLLVEAQPLHVEALKEFKANHKNVQLALAAAGESCGKIFFEAGDPWGGQASYTPYAKDNIEVAVTTIDREIEARSLPGPYLIKFDTHGFEIPILKGAVKALKQTDVLVIECYNFSLGPQCRFFWDMCVYLEERGFRCIDLVDPLYRPLDGSFWQADLIFVRSDRPEFLWNEFEAPAK